VLAIIMGMKKGDDKDMDSVLDTVKPACGMPPTIDGPRCLTLIPAAVLRIAMGIPQESHGAIKPPPVLVKTLAKAAALTLKTTQAMLMQCAKCAANTAIKMAMPMSTPPKGSPADAPEVPTAADMPFPPIAKAIQTHCGVHAPGASVKRREEKDKICEEHEKCYMKCPMGAHKIPCDKALVEAMKPLECDQPEGDMKLCKKHVVSYFGKINMLSMPRYIFQQIKNKCMLPPQYWTPEGKGQG
jgi:hypothetical protein